MTHMPVACGMMPLPNFFFFFSLFQAAGVVSSAYKALAPRGASIARFGASFEVLPGGGVPKSADVNGVPCAVLVAGRPMA